MHARQEIPLQALSIVWQGGKIYLDSTWNAHGQTLRLQPLVVVDKFRGRRKMLPHLSRRPSIISWDKLLQWLPSHLQDAYRLVAMFLQSVHHRQWHSHSSLKISGPVSQGNFHRHSHNGLNTSCIWSKLPFSLPYAVGDEFLVYCWKSDTPASPLWSPMWFSHL